MAKAAKKSKKVSAKAPRTARKTATSTRPNKSVLKKGAKKAAKKSLPKKRAVSKKTSTKKPTAMKKVAPKKSAKKSTTKQTAARKAVATKAPAKKKTAARKVSIPKRPVNTAERTSLRDMRAHAREGRSDDGTAFLPDPTDVGRRRVKDDLAEELGEEFVSAATSGESADDARDEPVTEEDGGPFITTSAESQYATGTDASNPEDAEREPFPTTHGGSR